MTVKDPRLQLDFFEMVFAVVRLIPAGRATSYGAIARYLGSGSSARTVGWAMNASHSVRTTVPAHRVVNRLGLLSGKAHFNPPEAMQQSLEREGIVVVNDAIQNWNTVFWDPAIELKAD
jgi:methylated-DNA-protein-cysteine methyltransferase-like protein